MSIIIVHKPIPILGYAEFYWKYLFYFFMFHYYMNPNLLDIILLLLYNYSTQANSYLWIRLILLKVSRIFLYVSLLNEAQFIRPYIIIIIIII
jgi:hypothetical protein